MSAAELNVVLAGAMIVLLAATAAVRLSARAGLPTLLVYLAIGLVIGEAGLGLEFEDAQLTQNLGLIALAVILAEGGLTTRWSVIRPVVGVSALLATLGVAISVAVTAFVAHAALNFDWRTSILLAAAVGSTDAAAVFSVLRRLPLAGRLGATLEAESGFNDPPVVILVTLVVSDAWTQANPVTALGQVGYQLAVGVLVGLVVGRVAQWVLSRSALPAAGLYPIATLAMALFAYAGAGMINASGLLAAYVTGLWLGNAPLPHRRATLGFAEGTAWLAQIGLFVLLGLLVSPGRLAAALVPALVVGGALLLLARPLTVLVCTTGFRVPWREQVFMSWAGLRGAVPIVVATIPLSAGLPAASTVFDVVFVLVVVFTLIQGPTLPFLARRLGIAAAGQALDLTVESAPLEEAGAELLQVGVPEGSRLVGVYVDELRLPAGAAVSLVVRTGRAFVPTGHTVVRAGDQLLVVTTESARRQTERRLRAVARAGRLARWFGEHGDDPPPAATSAPTSAADPAGNSPATSAADSPAISAADSRPPSTSGRLVRRIRPRTRTDIS
ncbi:potassium/proton antiporter [Actinopolymorpha singaporensis]|uniref:Potassium/proton antiporter, CPA1 family n=1 Tax=Actinopolymorpha singaporensis TaxID=117157 RepID=A0A1H1VER2_9ACTN|nr:potassium/proton antiporter [Actinopolymorpha singaporensis]SDS83100.1 potassium/proton antiporter, CPA1 family [Actinopolymorpha singaporensis]